MAQKQTEKKLKTKTYYISSGLLGFLSYVSSHNILGDDKEAETDTHTKEMCLSEKAWVVACDVLRFSKLHQGARVDYIFVN